MNFGVNKCATASLIKGKLGGCEGIVVTTDTIIPALNTLDSYKYLVKDLIVSSYKKRIKKLLKSSLNARNLIVAINVWAIPLVRYTAGLIKWTQAEVRALDISTRMMLNMYKCFSMKDDIDRLYVPRQRGGRGLLSVEYILQHEQLSLAKYLASKEEPLLQAVYRESQLGSLQESPSKFKARTSDEHFKAWKDKPLHG